MWFLTVWLAIMGAGGLCYPRRPRTTGALFILAGALTFVMWTLGWIGGSEGRVPMQFVLAAQCVALGLGTIWKFRDPGLRAAHVAEWTGKSESTAR